MFESPLSARSARIVSYAKLHRAAARRQAGLFLAEGPNSVGAAVSTGRAVEILATETAIDVYFDLLANGPDPVIIDDTAAAKLSDTVTTTGLFAVCRTLDVPWEAVIVREPQLLAVAVDLTEPGNAGTLIRSADAFGADAVILAGESVDPHNGKCVRGSAGSLFHVPIVRYRDTDELLDRLDAANIATCATAATGEVSLPTADLPVPCAWLFGNEAHGLRPEVLAAADLRVSIPIRGGAESLNLGAAATVCLYASATNQTAM